MKQGDPQANGDGLATRMQGLSIEETIAELGEGKARLGEKAELGQRRMDF